jgi:N-acetyl-anhydromuramyl-L-alanine amidase AmpD
MGVGPLRPIVGITIHYTGDVGIQRIYQSLISEGLGYHLVIAKSGEVIQLTFLDLRVYHAGKALWKGHSPNRTHVAIAIESYGELKRERGAVYRAWNDAFVAKENVAIRPSNFDSTQSPWDAATAKQEASLAAALHWFASYGILPKNVCGHDECAIPFGRKVDPGGVLSMSMPELRKSIA